MNGTETPRMQVVMVKDSEMRTYEYHLNGAEVVAVFNHQGGERYPMTFRKGRTRTIYTDKTGSYIKLDNYKHYLENMV